jgi:hypothetical protein
MEILRFEEAPSTAPKRKKSSKGYLAVGLVATLFGVSSAFATNSITINANNNISLGQGISTFTTCDDKIAVIPETALNDDLATFKLTKVTIGARYGSGDATATAQTFIDDGLLSAGEGCQGADFMVKFYSNATTPISICSTGTYGTAVVSGPTSYKCSTDTDAIYFRVVGTSHEITFTGGTAGAGFFDHISLETTSTTY